MKRLISLLLTLAMLLGILCSAPFAVSATDGESYTVYYVDSGYFETVYAYAWNGDERDESALNNNTMTLTDLASPEGSPVYEYTFDKMYDYIIFHDGGESKTAALEFKPDHYLWWSDEIWYENLDEVGADSFSGNTFYFIDVKSWSEIYAHAETYDNGVYEERTAQNAEFPGEVMSYYGDGVYEDSEYSVYEITISDSYEYISFYSGYDAETGVANNKTEKFDFAGNVDCVYNNETNSWYSYDDVFGGSEEEEEGYFDCDGFTCEILKDGITVKITGYNHSDYGEVVKIPETLNDYTVVAIGSQAFDDDSVTSITIPKTVTSIEETIWWNNPYVESLIVAEDNPVYTSRGTVDGEENTECNAIFQGNTLLVGCQNSIIPEGITAIAKYAFVYSSDMTEITIPSTVASIGNSAFFGCSSLTSITIPKAVTSIGETAFSDCNGLESITVEDGNTVYKSKGTIENEEVNYNAIIRISDNVLLHGCNNTVIPDDITAIEKEAFINCGGFAGDGSGYLDIPANVTYIGEEAFRGCSSLTSLNISASVNSIGGCAFADCSGLESITVAEGNETFHSGKNDVEYNAIIGTVTSYIDPDIYTDGDEYYDDPRVTLILGCMNTVIPDYVKVVGNSAFEGMMDMIEIIIPSSVIRVEESAFFNCYSMKRVTVMNPECDIYVDSSTLSERAVIRGYKGSTAHDHAFHYNMRFLAYEDTTDWGTIKESTIYFVNSEDWDRVYAYAYSSDGSKYSETPIIMNYSQAAESHYRVYEFTFDKKYDYVVFSNTKAQDDLVEDETTFKSSWYYNAYDNIWYENLSDIPTIPGYYISYCVQYGPDSEPFYSTSLSDRLVETETEGEYKYETRMFNGQTIKVVKCDENGEISEWYKEEGEGGYVYNGTSGVRSECVTVYFNPTGNAEWEYNYINVVAEHHYNDNGICDDCGEVKEGVEATLAGYNLTLSGRIEVNFFMALSEKVVNDSTAKMVFTVPDSGETYETEVSVADAVCDDRTGYYKFSCGVAAKEMTSDIKYQFVSEAYTSEVKTYSVKEYLECILKDSASYSYAVPLAIALLNYGTAAQKYFDYKTDDLANDSDYLNDTDKVLRDRVNFSEWTPYIEGEAEGITYYGSSLLLDSTTSVIHYFIIDEEVVVLESIWCDVNGEEVTLEQNGDLYELETPVILAQNLEDEMCVCVDGLNLYYNAFSFGYLVSEYSDNEALKDVVKALYEYNLAADDYPMYE